VNNPQGVNIRNQPSERTGQIIIGVPPGRAMAVIRLGHDEENRLWFLVSFALEDRPVLGWVLSSVVVELTTCPESIP
jgi:hypothetical protein